MSRFEYEILKVIENNNILIYEFKGEELSINIHFYITLLEVLNLLGEQGWELCDKLKGEGYIMKRKIIDI